MIDVDTKRFRSDQAFILIVCVFVSVGKYVKSFIAKKRGGGSGGGGQ